MNKICSALLFINTILLHVNGKDQEQNGNDFYQQYEEERLKELEERLSNEYGNLLVKQKTKNSFIYVFYRVKQQQNIYTTVTFHGEDLWNNMSIQQRKTKKFHNQRYNPRYKYTTPITSTNNLYLGRKFYTGVKLSEEIMKNITVMYLTKDEEYYFYKLDIFQDILSILNKTLSKAK